VDVRPVGPQLDNGACVCLISSILHEAKKKSGYPDYPFEGIYLRDMVHMAITFIVNYASM